MTFVATVGTGGAEDEVDAATAAETGALGKVTTATAAAALLRRQRRKGSVTYGGTACAMPLPQLRFSCAELTQARPMPRRGGLFPL